MTNDQSPVNDTPQRAPYETPVVIELNLTDVTSGKTFLSPPEYFADSGPS